MKHYSVLKNEIVEHFSGLDSGSVVLDCTLGFGGHSLALLESNPGLEIYAFDRDTSALELARERLKAHHRIHFYQSAFSQALDFLSDEILQRVRGIVADIGVSSMQLDEEHRGFSFHSSVLDMRMDTSAHLDASKVLNTYSSTRLEEILRVYGELRESKKLAELIVSYRQKTPFASCLQLSELIESHLKRTKNIHPATLVFQALRIEVNQELAELEGLLSSIESAHKKGVLKHAKVGIISFHSLEDRIVKQRFRQWSKSCICAPEVLKCECGGNHALGRGVSKKAIVPSQKEIAENKRSRSAKLRIFELGENYE